MAKKILCLRKGKQIFEDRCVAGQILFSVATDKEARVCFTCIRQRKEAEIRTEYPDEITEEQEHIPANLLKFQKIKLLLKKYGVDNNPPTCESISIKGNSITPFVSPERIDKFFRSVARNNFIYNLLEIDDHTELWNSSTNYLQKLFANASRVIPTVIQYVHRSDGGKKVFAILIPEGLPFTTFLKEGEKVRKIHGDFYKQPSDNVGRPLDESTLDKRAKIKELKKRGKSDKEIAMKLERPKLGSGDDIETFEKELRRATDRIRKQRYKGRN